MNATLQRPSPLSGPSLHFACPGCGHTFILPVTSRGDEPPRFSCDACGFALAFEKPLPPPDAPVEQCAVCGNRELYTQKDFNRTLGLWLVLASGMIALLVMAWKGHLWGLGVLFAVTLVDAFIYRYVREVAVCYLCHSIYRRYPKHPEHEPFYLGNEERFKKLRAEWIEGNRE